MWRASRPENGRPSPQNLVRPSSTTTGWVKKKQMSMSMAVVSPRVKAKPLTWSTDRMNRITAESSETPSDMRMVPRAFIHPVWRAVRSVRPSRISSRIRSK